MTSCSEKCLFYDKEYDDLRQLFNDVLFVDEKGRHVRKFHVCDLYCEGIPKGVFNGPKKCPDFEDKAKYLQGRTACGPKDSTADVPM